MDTYVITSKPVHVGRCGFANAPYIVAEGYAMPAGMADLEEALDELLCRYCYARKLTPVHRSRAVDSRKRLRQVGEHRRQTYRVALAVEVSRADVTTLRDLGVGRQSTDTAWGYLRPLVDSIRIV